MHATTLDWREAKHQSVSDCVCDRERDTTLLPAAALKPNAGIWRLRRLNHILLLRHMRQPDESFKENILCHFPNLSQKLLDFRPNRTHTYTHTASKSRINGAYRARKPLKSRCCSCIKCLMIINKC